MKEWNRNTHTKYRSRVVPPTLEDCDNKATEEHLFRECPGILREEAFDQIPMYRRPATLGKVQNPERPQTAERRRFTGSQNT